MSRKMASLIALALSGSVLSVNSTTFFAANPLCERAHDAMFAAPCKAASSVASPGTPVFFTAISTAARCISGILFCFWRVNGERQSWQQEIQLISGFGSDNFLAGRNLAGVLFADRHDRQRGRLEFTPGESVA